MTGTAGAPGPAAAVFDVDGTICATRSTDSLVWHRARQHPVLRHRLWQASLIWRAPLALAADLISRDLADRLVYAQYAGLSEQRLRDDAQLCFEELLRPACLPQALAEVQMHRAAGRRILLLTGGIDLVLQPLAEALGAELLAQRLESKGHVLTGRHQGYAILDCVLSSGTSQAERKAEALQAYARQTGLDLASSWGYGDSLNDAPMLKLVGHPIAINPDRKLRRKARALGWETRRWQHRASAGG